MSIQPRHRAREIAVQILYQNDPSLPPLGKLAPDQKILNQEVQKYFLHFNVLPELQEFITQLVTGTVANLTQIDALLEKHASHWKISRMSSVDRSLLRMAVFEMCILKEVAPSIVMNEAVEIAKQFGTSETPPFINGVLDSIHQGKGESPA